MNDRAALAERFLALHRAEGLLLVEAGLELLNEGTYNFWEGARTGWQSAHSAFET
ncbi:MAG TPA: hypothetical protein VGN78_11405 [Solirubrobacteraceae bacterium]|nr:hypothetical protein [Solirubrobacteraceae bacterium]